MTKPAVPELTDEMRASLTEAGIGPLFHDMTLLDDKRFGAGMKTYLTLHGDAIRQGTHSIFFHGVGFTDVIKLFCRGLHLHGVGCKLVPLVRMRPIINDVEFREIVTDIDVLVILNGQDVVRGNPLHDNVAADVEYVIGKRREAKKATFIQCAIPEDVTPGELPNCYWSQEMMDVFAEHYDRLNTSRIVALGKTQS